MSKLEFYWYVKDGVFVIYFPLLLLFFYATKIMILFYFLYFNNEYSNFKARIFESDILYE